MEILSLLETSTKGYKTPTKINIISSEVLNEANDGINVFLVIVGTILNISIIIIPFLWPMMRTSTVCHLCSLTCSNFMLLVDAFNQILHFHFDIEFVMNLDYVLHVTFNASVMTIASLSVERYVSVCKDYSSICATLYNRFSVRRSLRSLLFVWLGSIIITVLELHLYDLYEEEVVHHIYAYLTVIFLMVPCLVLIILDGFIVYEMVVIRDIEGGWREEDLQGLRLLIGLTLGVFLTIIPYRVTRLAMFSLPAESCCASNVLEILYMLLKMSSIVLPVICIAASRDLHVCLQEILRCTFGRDRSAPGKSERSSAGSILRRK